MPTDTTRRLARWGHDRGLLLELFVLSNLAFLIVDIGVAHAMNNFAHWAEWIPAFYGAFGTLALGVGLFVLRMRGTTRLHHWIGDFVGWGGVIVGVAGLVWHLEGQFFQVMTLQHLVYSAPFAAPLAFAGLGLLLLMNRRVPQDVPDWGAWVVLFAWGGFVGNFALSLADHAQNGFFYAAEWIPVVASALAVGYFFTVLIAQKQRSFLKLGYAVLGLQVLVGLIGFILHVAPIFGDPEVPFIDRVVFGAPVFAPLLFVDLSALAALGLWDLQVKADAPTPVAAS